MLKPKPGSWFAPSANQLYRDMDATVTGPTGQICAFQVHSGMSREQAEAYATLVSASPELLSELRIADAIITVLLNALPAEGRLEVARTLDKIHDGEGAVRSRERHIALNKAEGKT